MEIANDGICNVVLNVDSSKLIMKAFYYKQPSLHHTSGFQKQRKRAVAGGKEWRWYCYSILEGLLHRRPPLKKNWKKGLHEPTLLIIVQNISVRHLLNFIHSKKLVWTTYSLIRSNCQHFASNILNYFPALRVKHRKPVCSPVYLAHCCETDIWCLRMSRICASKS